MGGNLKSKLLLFVLSGLSVLFVAPAFVHGYIYPTGGDDTAAHLLYFQNIDTQSPLYWGQFLVGKLVNVLPFDPVASFSVFNYAGFVLMMVTVGLTTAAAVNPMAGILAAIIVGFGNIIAINQFWSGTIFGLVNVGIFLPLLLLAWHKRRRAWLIVGGVIGIIFAVFHPSGLYLLGLIPVVLFYEVLRSRGRLWLTGWWRELWQNRFLMCLGGLILALAFACLLDMAKPNSARILADTVILLGVFVAGVLAMLPLTIKGAFSSILAVAVLVMSLPNIILWWNDNSAIKPADKSAIAYLDAMPGQSFSAGAEVAQSVYGLYLQKRFVDVGGDYLIRRSKPQTCGSDLASEWFRNSSRLGISLTGYTEIARFTDADKIVVTLYERRG